MAIKHQLQHSIFNGNYYNNNSGILVKVKSDEGIGNFVSILQYLETIASILQDIEVRMCVHINMHKTNL